MIGYMVTSAIYISSLDEVRKCIVEKLRGEYRLVCGLESRCCCVSQPGHLRETFSSTSSGGLSGAYSSAQDCDDRITVTITASTNTQDGNNS